MKKAFMTVLVYGVICHSVSAQNTFPSSGNVGIGTTSPQTKLDVVGQVYSWNTGFGAWDVYTSAKNYANFGSENAASVIMSSNVYIAGNKQLYMAKTHSTMSGAAIIIPGNQQPYQNSILFYTRPTGAVSQDALYTGNIAMMINSANNNVGIGTATPSEKLSVNGNIRAKKVIVTQSGWPDYVFEPSYKLPSLDSISAFIKVNKHLPEMPSAAAIEKDGQDIGDIQKLLLKKVEELTLYVIELKRKNEEQEKKIKFLDQKLNNN